MSPRTFWFWAPYISSTNCLFSLVDISFYPFFFNARRNASSSSGVIVVCRILPSASFRPRPNYPAASAPHVPHSSSWSEPSQPVLNRRIQSHLYLTFCSSKKVYPFTAPADSPFTRCLWKKRMSITIGIVAETAEAAARVKWRGSSPPV
jgi:hypothetical protein